MRAFVLVMLWLAGSGVAVAVAWEGVNIVDSQLINPRGALQSSSPAGTPQVPPPVFDAPTDSDAAAADNSLASGSADKAVPAERSSEAGDVAPSPTVDRASPTPSLSQAAPADTPTVRPTGRPTPTRRPRPPAPTPSSPTPLAAATPTATPTATPAATPSPEQAATPDPSPSPVPEPTPGPLRRIFHLAGGTTEIDFSSDAVVALWQSPANGFTGEIKPKGATSVRVEFRSDDWRSRIDAWWDNGAVWVITEGDSTDD